MTTEINTKLQGTEKQIAWAEDIRQTITDYYDQKLNHLAEIHADDEAKVEKYTKAKEAMHETAESIDSAEWWINHRKPLSIGLGGGYADISKTAIIRHPELENIKLLRKAAKLSHIK
jgi:4-diphosphocytidyl-2C-methyl-D-erythritol kinase